MRQWMILCERMIDLPPDVVAAFEELGDMQRGEPEHAMLQIQYLTGGGVLNPVVEHVGDIIHRMSHAVRWGSVEGREKIIKTLQWLSHAYGFEREMQENIVNSARHRGIAPAVLKKQISQLLRKYAAAHAKLPVYNRAQWLARQATVSIGMEDFDNARAYLTALMGLAKTEDTFAEHALQYSRDADGTLLQYHPSMQMAEAAMPKQYLFHLTSTDALESIIERGIDPPSYWGVLSVVRYYERMKLHVGEPLIFRVPLDQFRPMFLEPDMRGLQDPPDSSVTEMTEDELEDAWDESDQTWQASLNLIGSVAYHGVMQVTNRHIFKR